MDQIQDLLARYAQRQQELVDFQAMCDQEYAQVMALVPPHVRAELERIAEARLTGSAELAQAISTLAEQIKAAVATACHTVKGPGYTAVFTQGRAVWADDFLQGFAAVHPEILQGRREGKPSVSIRKDK